MCDIHSAIVSCCELPVCMLWAAVSCLCAAVYCSHHCRRAAVITVVVLQSSLSSFLSAFPQPPKRLLHIHTSESQFISLCVSTPYPCVSPSYPVCHTERDRSRPARCFGKHRKRGERDTEGVCCALSVLEVYTYIYMSNILGTTNSQNPIHIEAQEWRFVVFERRFVVFENTCVTHSREWWWLLLLLEK